MRLAALVLLLAFLTGGAVDAPVAPAAKRATAAAKADKQRKAAKRRSVMARKLRGRGRVPAAALAQRRAPLTGSQASPSSTPPLLDGSRSAQAPALPDVLAPLVPAVGVTAREFSLTLSRTSVPAGSVRFQLVNRGEDPHDLRVAPLDGQGGGGDVAETPPGGVTNATFELKAGAYYVFCTLTAPVDHESAGMRATLRADG